MRRGWWRPPECLAGRGVVHQGRKVIHVEHDELEL
jgi:hypothetical protein